jgi:hypothetical protein
MSSWGCRLAMKKHNQGLGQIPPVVTEFLSHFLKFHMRSNVYGVWLPNLFFDSSNMIMIKILDDLTEWRSKESVPFLGSKVRGKMQKRSQY